MAELEQVRAELLEHKQRLVRAEAQCERVMPLEKKLASMDEQIASKQEMLEGILEGKRRLLTAKDEQLANQALQLAEKDQRIQELLVAAATPGSGAPVPLDAEAFGGSGDSFFDSSPLTSVNSAGAAVLTPHTMTATAAAPVM